MDHIFGFVCATLMLLAVEVRSRVVHRRKRLLEAKSGVCLKSLAKVDKQPIAARAFLAIATYCVAATLWVPLVEGRVWVEGSVVVRDFVGPMLLLGLIGAIVVMFISVARRQREKEFQRIAQRESNGGSGATISADCETQAGAGAAMNRTKSLDVRG